MKFGGGTGYYGSNKNQWGEEISRPKKSSGHSLYSNTSGVSTWARDKAAKEAKKKAEKEKKVVQEHEQNLKAAINKASIYNDVMFNPERLYLEGLEIFNLSMRTSVESIYRKNGFDTAKHNLNYALLFGELRAFELLLDLYGTGSLATFLIMIARELGVAEMSDKAFLKHKVEDTSCLNSVQKCAEIIRQNAKKYGSSIITAEMKSEAIAAYNDGLEVKYQLLSPAQVRNMNIQAHSWEKGLEWKNDFSDTKVAVIQKGDFACGIMQKTICNTNFTLMVHYYHYHYQIRITQYQSIELPKAILPPGENINISLAVTQPSGQRISEIDPAYFTVNYNDIGKLVKISLPSNPVIINVVQERSPVVVMYKGNIYVLPVNSGNLHKLTTKVNENGGQIEVLGNEQFSVEPYVVNMNTHYASPIIGEHRIVDDSSSCFKCCELF
ncbi:120 KDa Rickettsia-like surface antigen domain protein [Candidatus Trichorickettsia mobilis]|uniref:120 kDa Rickettsia-like surface antigen domain protein n=1 Tax=Candidatus Trichorickettsia mobilis TaxID=1346319 RepID=A0ABZ0UXU2_9RICK|nr:hypothetical protein [Candidatus Trichorickettsia mobilis]WPY01447.1 120 KDa Rickettsia-like surface antigen domain protein [Candidatus Trichorickettsia mobilis]